MQKIPSIVGALICYIFWQGEDIFYSLLNAGTIRGLKVRIVQSEPTKSFPSLDTDVLMRKKAAEVGFFLTN